MDATDIAGTSKSSFCQVMWKTITAIVSCDELSIKIPDNPESLKVAMAGFANVSWEQATIDCVGALDGFLARIEVLS